MTNEELERVKACRRDPKMKQNDVGNKADTTIDIAAVPATAWRPGQAAKTIPGWTHTDSGVVFRSRTALKKAIRIAWSKPNPLRQSNKDRLHRALNQIIRANDMSIPEMVKAEITGNVKRSAESGKIIDFLQQTIREEVQKALGSKAQIEAKCRAWALEEAKRLVAESLTLEFRITGDGMVKAPGTGRALRLQPEHE